MDALIVVDMQVGLLNGEPKHDLRGVIERINRLAAKVRGQSGVVIFMQHGSGAEVVSRPHRRGIDGFVGRRLYIGFLEGEGPLHR